MKHPSFPVTFLRLLRADTRAGRTNLAFFLGAVITVCVWSLPQNNLKSAPAPYIVQGESAEQVKQVLSTLHISDVNSLPIIDSVVVGLTASERATLERHAGIRAIYPDLTVVSTRDRDDDDDEDGNHMNASDAAFAQHIGASELHQQQITGDNVTIAVIDSGIDGGFDNLVFNDFGERRLLASFDAVRQTSTKRARDKNGHGTHVSSVILGSHAESDEVSMRSIAPNANLVNVSAFDRHGIARYSDVIHGIGWVVEHQHQYRIRVLNLSFSTPAQSYYWDDPLNQAVMRAWQSGIVVVVSAGNSGPAPMTIGVPGNVPYVITVGAMDNNATSAVINDDRLARFSAAGPTAEGFIKPDIVAPGRHIIGLMDEDAYLGERYEDYFYDDEYFAMSGTSQSAAMVSGAVALMLQADPSLTPDAVKCRLLSSARQAVDAQGALAYSVFQQGYGLVDAAGAVFSSAVDCANQGLDIALDIDGREHYVGPARITEDGHFYVSDEPQSQWNGDLNADGYMWRGTSNSGKPKVKKNSVFKGDNGLSSFGEGATPGLSSVLSANWWVDD